MKEQDLFHYLFWVSPVLSGIITVLQAIENAIFFPETPLLVPYSCCAKTPFPMDKMEELFILKVRVAHLSVTSFFFQLSYMLISATAKISKFCNRKLFLGLLGKCYLEQDSGAWSAYNHTSKTGRQ